MRKNIFIAIFAAAFFCLSQIMTAVPAKRGLITRTQPDGSTINVIVHGDEWFHYVTDENGNVLAENEKGFMVPSSNTLSDIEVRMQKARRARAELVAMREQVIMKSKVSGSPKIPVLLVQFKNKSFSVSNPKTAFSNLLNQSGYSANGGTGSVKDYYKDQSRGKYTPEFVVMDVVTLSGNMSTYGDEDENAAQAIYEACQSLDSTVDFSQFDNDGDGKIDMILMYFAGYNEAEGGPESTIWPHQFDVSYVVTNARSFDGVKLSSYFCTSELKGSSGTNMCGIGTTCHEFAHSLGLPDFYDTNYNEYGDGEAGATYDYDVMCSGAYNNNGRTPPWMNAEELVMLGWMDSITSLTTTGSVTIPSIAAASPVAYKTAATVDGEYFLYECRPGTGWDAPLTGGMLVYHVDKARSHSITWKTSSSETTSASAYNLWTYWESYNAINCNGSHPCFYIVPAGNQSSLNYAGTNFVFPGTSSVKTYTPSDWSGSDTGFSLSGISYDSSAKTVSFSLVNSNTCGVEGMVLDSEGNPLQGVTVNLRASSVSSVSKGRFSVIKKAAGAVLASATTAADGSYSVSVDSPGTYVLEASKSGYQTKSVTLAVSRLMSQNFYLLRDGEEAPSEIYTYPDEVTWNGYAFDTSSSDFNAANIYPSSMMAPYAGKQIKSISFMLSGESGSVGKTYALLDFGDERKVAKEVSSPVIDDWTTVDLSEEELIIPDGKDIYAGYALSEWTYYYPFVASGTLKSDDLVGVVNYFSLTSTTWYSLATPIVFAIKMKIGDYVKPETGYNVIENPGNGVYALGSTFDLNLIESSGERKPSSAGIQWFYDDEPVSGSVRLSTAGTHVVKAVFTTSAGTRKEVELEIEVN